MPEDAELYCVTTAMMHYARAVALASLGRVEETELERNAFFKAHERLPKTRMLFNNTCLDILAIAATMMLGEIEYRKGRFASQDALYA
jgi:hypothetical protein